MKKLLVTGGVLFTIMPALAGSLDTKPLILPDSTNNSCSGSEYEGNYTAENPKQMQAIFVTDSCAAGTYFNVGDDAYIDSTDGKIKNASCTSCNSTGHYCPGIADISQTVVNGVVSTTGLENCPTGYTDGADTTDINNCLANCSLNDLNYTIANASSYALVANTATYNSDPTLQQFCEKTVAVNGCAAGYTRTSTTTILGLAMPTPETYSAGTYADHVTWTGTVNGLSVGGIGFCKTSDVNNTKVGCFMRATSLNGHQINGAVLEAAQYDTQAECEAGCAQLTDSKVGAFFADTTNGNRFAQLLNDRYFCVANEVNINWGDNIGSTCTYGETYTAPSTTPTAPQGYKFIGWKVEIEESTGE